MEKKKDETIYDQQYQDQDVADFLSTINLPPPSDGLKPKNPAWVLSEELAIPRSYVPEDFERKTYFPDLD